MRFCALWGSPGKRSPCTEKTGEDFCTGTLVLPKVTNNQQERQDIIIIAEFEEKGEEKPGRVRLA